MLIPWVTYTEPELAQTGLTEAQARDAQAQNPHLALALSRQ